MLAHELFYRGKERNPDGTYLAFQDEEYTYEEFDDRTSRLANFLLESGISMGDRVGSVIPNCTEHIELLFACSKIGAVFTPCNPELKPPALVHNFELSEPQVVITTTDLEDTVTDAANESPVDRLMTLDTVRRERDRHPATIDSVTYDDGEPLIHIYTSGTTGPPKACELSHFSWTESAINFSDRLGFAPSDNIAACQPLHHAILWPIALAPCAVGATVVLFEKFSSSQWWDWMREYDVTAFHAVGGLLRMLANMPKSDSETNHSVDLVYTNDVKPDLEQRFDLRLVSGYALSEDPFLSINPPDPNRRKVGSIGFPSAGKRVKVVDNDGNEVPRGETGELIVKSPYQMNRYYNRPEKTKEAIKDGWLYTGDLMKQDDDGYLYFIDRKKHIVRRSGQNISSEEVEEVILELPDVENAAIIPTPDEFRGEEVKAVIKTKPDSRFPPERVIDHCEGRLSEHKVPRYVEFVDELPTSPTEKIQKAVLEEREREENPDHWDREERRS
jgi:crotonobetaine/carnitine-CoA ligase